MANELSSTRQVGKDQQNSLQEPNWWTARHLARAVSTSTRLWCMVTDISGVVIFLNGGAACVVKVGGQIKSSLTHESATKLNMALQQLGKNAHQSSLVLWHCTDGSLISVDYEVWSFDDSLVWLGWPQGNSILPETPHVSILYEGMDEPVDTYLPISQKGVASTDTLDALTGAWSKSHLEHYVESLCRQQIPFAIAVIDIDGLTTYNQEFGHDGGDSVLKHVVTIMRSSLRETDAIARLGGDECAVICPKATQVDALRLCLRLGQLVSATPIKLGENDVVPVTVSLGWACSPSDGDNLNSLMIAADLRLYRMKSAAQK